MSQVNFESSAVQSYLSNLQAVISRMASNSSTCKTWCITLVSAVIVFATGENRNPDSIWVSIVPIGLFLVLDAYYLGLERHFRDLYNGFIRKLHSGSAKVEDIFVMTPRVGTTDILASTGRGVLSISVWPFYGLLFIMLVVLRTWIF